MPSRAHCNRSTTGSRGRWASRAAQAAHLLLALLLGLLVAGVTATSARADKRVALVIGNSAYQGLKPLQNPGNDAADIATALRSRGFDVIVGRDLGRGAMNEAVGRFVRLAREADVSLLYYAGHGFQVASQNYLVPVDAAIRTREDVSTQTLDLRSIVGQLEGTKGIHLVFLDACRNNPLREAGGEAAASLSNGLARVGSAAGFLFVYATQPDNIAFDGGGRNSPFATALLSHVATKGQDIASMMILVRKDVLAATGGYQVPWENSSLTQRFSFVPGAADAVSPETQLWQLAASSREPALLRMYKTRYPEGAHAGEVDAMLASTKLAALPGDKVEVRSTPTNDILADDRLWSLAQRSRLRPLVEFYIARNPDGRHAVEARDLLGALPSADDSDAPPEQICERVATHPRDATANNAGVPLAELAQNAELALGACTKARALHPEMPHFTALLARSLAAAGRRDEAIRLYRDAAAAGDLRGMVSLGLILETGDGAPRDVRAAVTLYERAAEAGSPDGAINLAVALMVGNGQKRDPVRAVELLKRAADAGSAIATYNLGVLVEQGVTGSRADALEFFRKATELGDARGYVPAAILLDEGRGVRKDPGAAAAMLLLGVGSDSGEATSQIVSRSASWSADTIRSIQNQLKKAGFYAGVVDGKGGPKMAGALREWRKSGSLDTVQAR